MRCGSPMRRRGDGERRAAEKAKIPLRNLRHRQDIGSRPAGNLIKLRIENRAKRQKGRGCEGLLQACLCNSAHSLSAPFFQITRRIRAALSTARTRVSSRFLARGSPPSPATKNPIAQVLSND
eukprot:COSAG04_NODE_1376_length_7017_cov_3.776814_7_plen_123_part_00